METGDGKEKKKKKQGRGDEAGEEGGGQVDKRMSNLGRGRGGGHTTGRNLARYGTVRSTVIGKVR